MSLLNAVAAQTINRTKTFGRYALPSLDFNNKSFERLELIGCCRVSSAKSLPLAAPMSRRNGGSPLISWRCAEMRPLIWRPFSQPAVIAARGWTIPGLPRIEWPP